MGFIDDDQGIARQIVEQCRRRLARLLAGQVPRIILDPAAETHLFQHLQVEHRPLMKPLRLEQFAFLDQLWFPPLQLLTNRFDRALQGCARHDIV